MTRNNTKQTPAGPLTIGICGTTHKSGTTTVALAFSNYFCSAANKWVACLELNRNLAFHTLNQGTRSCNFHRCGIDFYPESNLSDYSLLLKEHYDVLVLDFGVLTKGTAAEFLHCDLCIVLGYVNPWNSTSYWEWISRHTKLLSTRKKEQEIIYMGNLAQSEDVSIFRHQYGIKPIPVPFIQNPFQLPSAQWNFIERALERNSYTTRKLYSSY